MNIARIFENAPDLNVSAIMCDSRVKSRRAIFFCEPGLVNDGHDFVAQAIANGAVCVVHSRPLTGYDPKVVYIKVDDTVAALNEFAAFFYGEVSRKLKVFGVTGTNGKTSIAWAIRHLVDPLLPCGYFGDVGIIYADQHLYKPTPVPTAVFVHKTMYDMRKAGMKAVAIETSSLGLDMHRFDTVAFACAVFSNLTHEHLDYHGTYENYYKAKLRLFRLLGAGQPAIINIDDPFGQRLVKDTVGRPVTYAVGQPADYRAVDIHLSFSRTDFTLIHGQQRFAVQTRLLALFNVYNLLAAIAAVHETMGTDLGSLVEMAGRIPQVDGRMETIEQGQPFGVLVDYARTPEGCEKTLGYLRSVTAPGKRILAVLGSAGSRDVKKRPELGAIVDKYCQVIVLTSEDPRQEDPAAIAADIQAGIKDNASSFIEDRYDAIRQSIELANSGDTVAILGKGDERFMVVNGQKVPWMGDGPAARQIIKQYLQDTTEGENDEDE